MGIMVMSCISIAICSSECLMGDCTEPDTCVCDPGWTGQTCNTGEGYCMILYINYTIHRYQ